MAKFVTISGVQFEKYPDDDYIVRRIWFCSDYKGYQLELDKDKATGQYGFTVYFRNGSHYRGGFASSLEESADIAKTEADAMDDWLNLTL